MPKVTLPRLAVAGRRYMVSIDLEHEVPPEKWPYDREEFELTCALDTRTLFEPEPQGETTLILHRFGGTYGAAHFIAEFFDQISWPETR